MQNYAGVALCQNFGDMQNMKSCFLALLFHVASNKDNMCHYSHFTTGPHIWCKCNVDRPNNTQTYKPVDSEQRKCLRGKTQKVNESFNSKIWERIHQKHFYYIIEFEIWQAWCCCKP